MKILLEFKVAKKNALDFIKFIEKRVFHQKLSTRFRR